MKTKSLAIKEAIRRDYKTPFWVYQYPDGHWSFTSLLSPMGKTLANMGFIHSGVKATKIFIVSACGNKEVYVLSAQPESITIKVTDFDLLERVMKYAKVAGVSLDEFIWESVSSMLKYEGFKLLKGKLEGMFCPQCHNLCGSKTIKGGVYQFCCDDCGAYFEGLDVVEEDEFIEDLECSDVTEEGIK